VRYPVPFIVVDFLIFLKFSTNFFFSNSFTDSFSPDLVRVEHIGLHEGHVGKAQFYIECFQLKIESSGTGKLGPTVKIPGVYKATDPGIAFNKWNNPKSYTFPGPAVWNGAASAASEAVAEAPAAEAPATQAPAEEEEETCE
jgi:hypothetical protein